MDNVMPPIQLVMTQPQQVAETPLDQVPARVRIACGLLDHMTMKTMTKIAVNDIGIEEIDGEKLIHEEEQCQASALALLTNYFNGKLKPTATEKVVKPCLKRPHGSVRIECPACFAIHGKVNGDCLMCAGVGLVYVTRIEK